MNVISVCLAGKDLVIFYKIKDFQQTKSVLSGKQRTDSAQEGVPPSCKSENLGN